MFHSLAGQVDSENVIWGIILRGFWGVKNCTSIAYWRF
jgi:hypothetical protein